VVTVISKPVGGVVAGAGVAGVVVAEVAVD
jgi:hypothetical protein